MIPVFEPTLDLQAHENVKDCLDTNWISSSGKYITKFESAFAKFHDSNHAIALSNGTAALEVALHSIGIKEGDEVIIPSFTIISVAIAVLRVGAIPRFSDVETDTWNIDPEYVKTLINDKTRAIIVVHSFGHPASIESILKIANDNGLKVVEDTAEALGSKINDGLCGTFGDIGTFSLYANKLITTGEGGIIITNNNDYAEAARKYINLYFGDDERFSHENIGFNFRMTNIQASIGCAQLENIDKYAKEKIRIGQIYKKKAANSKFFTFQKSSPNVHHVYWMYSFIVKNNLDLSGYQVVKFLREKGIDSRQLFKGLHLQKPLIKYLLPDQKNLLVTEELYNKGFYLPSSLKLKEEDISFIMQALEDIALCNQKK